MGQYDVAQLPGLAAFCEGLAIISAIALVAVLVSKEAVKRSVQGKREQPCLDRCKGG